MVYVIMTSSPMVQHSMVGLGQCTLQHYARFTIDLFLTMVVACLDSLTPTLKSIFMYWCLGFTVSCLVIVSRYAQDEWMNESAVI